MGNTVLRQFAKYVSLNIAGMIGLSCYILADTFFVANGLGTNGLAALNISIPLYSLISGIGLMLGIGGATKYSILRAQGKNEDTDNIFTQTLLIGLAFGIVLVLLGIFASGFICEALGASGACLDMAKVYVTTIMCFSPFFIANNILIAFIRNDGAPRLSMAAMLSGSLSNIVLDYILIFPLKLGMFGAAFATGLAPIISLAVMSQHFLRRRNNFRIIKTNMNRNVFYAVCRLGGSSLIAELSSGIVLVVFNLVILGLAGNVGVAAYGIIANISLVVIAMFTGIAQGIQPILSKLYGTGSTRAIKNIYRYAIALSCAIAVLVYVFSLFASQKIISVFNGENDGILAALANEGMMIYFSGFIFAGINIVSAAYFSSLEKPKPAFAISLSRGFIFIIPTVLIMSALFGIRGAWMSFVLTEAITTMLCLVIRFKSSAEKRIY